MSIDPNNPAAVRFSRRHAIGLGGIAAVAGRSLPAGRTATAQDEVEMTDFPLLVTMFGDELEHFEPERFAFLYDEDRRRQNVVMSSDPLAGQEGVWLGGATGSFIRPNQGSNHDLNWDRIAYLTIDSFPTNRDASTFLESCAGIVDAYQPTVLPIREGMAANAFGATVAFPYGSDPNITIHRSIIGMRKRSDAALLTIDSYGEPVPNDELLALGEVYSTTLGGAYSGTALIPWPALIGNPTEADFFFRMVDGQFVPLFSDRLEENDPSAEAARLHNAGAEYAAYFHWRGRLAPENSPREYFGNWWQYPDDAAAADFAGRLGQGIPEWDALSGIERTPVELSLDTLDGITLHANHFIINLGPDQVVPGRTLIVQFESNVLALGEIDPNPLQGNQLLETPVPNASAWQEYFGQTFEPIVLNQGTWAPLRGGILTDQP